MTYPVWQTTAGSIGIYPALIPMEKQLEANAVLPAVSVTYKIISGSLAPGVVMDENGLIAGIPDIESRDTSFTFVVRATDNLGGVRDRTFIMTTSGAASPSFITPSGSILSTQDSIWIELPILYDNPISTNEVFLRVVQGSLPEGLEMNSSGLIRGYPAPPTTTVNLGIVNTYSTGTSSINNSIIVNSTTGFSKNRPIVFSGSVIGGLTLGQTYYVREVLDATSFTISTTQDGPEYSVFNDSGFMLVSLPNVSVGQATIRTYSFTVELLSPLGNDIESYFITVVNQQTPISQGGPGKGKNTRNPTIYNTRPATYNIENDNEYYGYYLLPPDPIIPGMTYAPNEAAYIGQIKSDDYFSFKILGHDFDNNALEYVFADLPLGLTGDTITGWITGVPVIASSTISQFSFSAFVRKSSPAGMPVSPFVSPTFKFTFKISDTINGNITWITDNDLGTVFNGTVAYQNLRAVSDVELSYRLVEGTLPPNIILADNGELTGTIAYQPTDTYTDPNEVNTFTFTVEAYSKLYSVVSSTKTFTIKVLQELTQPTDILYIQCNPSIADRVYIAGLLNDESIIPEALLYRPNDPNFGKATSIIYEHAYGIYANNLDAYVAAVTKNHYWRNITLGEIETAVATDEQGNIIYEVVYSKVIDNLINPKGQSVSKEIFWPRLINLGLGPWYTSSTEIFTSYIDSQIAFVNTQIGSLSITDQIENPLELNQGKPLFFTSLTPGYARLLYPNSLPNMREQVGDVLGQELNSNVLPLWMRSQQKNGNTLGFIPAWVIAYTKPDCSEIVKNNINNQWVDFLGRPLRLNEINFQLDRFTVDKSLTYNFDTTVSPPAWTGLPSADPVPDPIDSKDFHVLFPRKTILPDDPQYY